MSNVQVLRRGRILTARSVPSREFSLSSLGGRRGSGRGGPSCLRLALMQAVLCPPPPPPPPPFLAGGGGKLVCPWGGGCPPAPPPPPPRPPPPPLLYPSASPANV